MGILSVESGREAQLRYTRLFVPCAILVTAWEFLRHNGDLGMEQLCFLAGRAVQDGEGIAAQVTSCVLPLTGASASYVTLTSHAQTALILDELEARAELPLVSLHTHGDGGAAGCGPEHSEIDDHGVALTPEDGLFSGVVPYFAHGSPFDFVRQTTLYERVDGSWLRLGEDEKHARIILHNHTLRMVPTRRNGEGR